MMTQSHAPSTPQIYALRFILDHWTNKFKPWGRASCGGHPGSPHACGEHAGEIRSGENKKEIIKLLSFEVLKNIRFNFHSGHKIYNASTYSPLGVTKSTLVQLVSQKLHHALLVGSISGDLTDDLLDDASALAHGLLINH